MISGNRAINFQELLYDYTFWSHTRPHWKRSRYHKFKTGRLDGA